VGIVVEVLPKAVSKVRLNDEEAAPGPEHTADLPNRQEHVVSEQMLKEVAGEDGVERCIGKAIERGARHDMHPDIRSGVGADAVENIDHVLLRRFDGVDEAAVAGPEIQNASRGRDVALQEAAENRPKPLPSCIKGEPMRSRLSSFGPP